MQGAIPTTGTGTNVAGVQGPGANAPAGTVQRSHGGFWMNNFVAKMATVWEGHVTTGTACQSARIAAIPLENIDGVTLPSACVARNKNFNGKTDGACGMQVCPSNNGKFS